MSNPSLIIAAKDIRDSARDPFLAIVAGFLAVAALTALVTGAIALAGDVATYNAAKDALLALGKSTDEIKPPEFYPLRLLRGAVEQIEIVGAAIAILAGFRAAAAERGRQTLALILTRPLTMRQFTLGKIIAGIGLLALALGGVFALCAALLHGLSGIGLTQDDLARLALIWAMSLIYTACFFLLGFGLTLHLRRPATALLIAFAVWLILVLIAPQIGDTMDPDNQIAGGVFHALSIAKADQTRIMQGYTTFETIRDGIEQASVTKHFERLSFAVLGIKATYTGLPLGPILIEKIWDMVWIIATALGLGTIVLALPLNPKTLTEE